MLSQQIKSVVAMSALVLASSSFATTTYTPKAQTTKLAPTANGFVYPASILNDEDFVETGILFVYSDHILGYFNGDTERLLEYVNDSIAYNNQAFVNSNIPIKRVVSGLVYVGADEIWSLNDPYIERLNKLNAWQQSEEGIARKAQTQYSYLVSLAGYITPENEWPLLGQAFAGDNVSWISPYNINPEHWSERTLSHELGHNDGFKHTAQDEPLGGAHVVRHDAAGTSCGSHGSIMAISGSRAEPFFSDTQISLIEDEQEHNCGSMGEANAGQVYRDMLNTDIANREGTFRNIQPTRAKTGVVSIHNNLNSVVEGESVQFDVIFEGADKGDSVNFIVRQGSAGLDDFYSQTGLVTHNGESNVYTISVPTRSDENDETTETFSVELVYPNGVRLDSVNVAMDASIIDVSDANTAAQTGNTTTPSNQVSNLAANNTANANSQTNVVSNTSASTSTDSASGGSIGVFSLLVGLIVAVRRFK